MHDLNLIIVVNFTGYGLLRTCNVGTYDWMKDETTDYKAVKENAENAQGT